MIKYFTAFLIFLFITSCGYPDIDNVPDFKDTKLTDEELIDYCSISNTCLLYTSPSPRDLH